MIAADIRHFLCAQLAFWLLVATDGHAKNFAIFLLPGGGDRMTPLYDVISVWPVIGRGPNPVAWQQAKLAMAVRSRNVHCELARIDTRHWLGLAQRSGAEGVWEAMPALVARVEPAITAVQAQLPPGYPERLRVFRSCPLTTPKRTRSSLQMLAMARAMSALCL